MNVKISYLKLVLLLNTLFYNIYSVNEIYLKP